MIDEGPGADCRNHEKLRLYMASEESSRQSMVFVSHANPEENEFARWLTLQLANEGYATPPDGVGTRNGPNETAHVRAF
jgi:hypothetical protein